jgi:methylated-DNA-[protein]-cysteine S-methyltransferase
MSPEAAHADAGIAGAIKIAVRQLKTPIGVLQVAASEDSLLYIELPRQHGEGSFEHWLRGRLRRTQTPALNVALRQLREYFAGKRRQFDVPVDPGGTDFQRRVWQLIAAIPFGETTSYGQIATQLGDERLARAVGAAAGANPIPIIIPCHRVIGAGGSLVGYGGGLRMKVWLLRHEGAIMV